MSRAKARLLVGFAIGGIFVAACIVIPPPTALVAGGPGPPGCTSKCANNPFTVCDGTTHGCPLCGGGLQDACSNHARIVYHAPSIVGSDIGTVDVCFDSVPCKTTYPCQGTFPVPGRCDGITPCDEEFNQDSCAVRRRDG